MPAGWPGFRVRASRSLRVGQPISLVIAAPGVPPDVVEHDPGPDRDQAGGDRAPIAAGDDDPLVAAEAGGRVREVARVEAFRHQPDPRVVGIVEVCALAHHDSTTDDPRWECVDIRAVRDMPKPVTLKDVKANPKLEKMALVTSMRLSVQPVTEDEWIEVCRMGGLDREDALA